MSRESVRIRGREIISEISINFGVRVKRGFVGD